MEVTMEICWDTLESVRLTKNGTFKKGTAIYVYKDACVVCGEPFLAIKSKSNNIFCSNKCSSKGSNNPFFGKKHIKESINKMSKKHVGSITSGATKKKLSKIFNGSGNSNYKGGVKEKGLPLFDTYAKQISYAEEIRSIYINGLKLLEVKCVYCGRWFIPKIQAIYDRKKALLHDPINVKRRVGEGLFYCTIGCRGACSVYHTIKQQKKFYLSNTSLEVLPDVRKKVLKRDRYRCTKCGVTIEDIELHCHCVYDETNVDSCLTECVKCHNITHCDLETEKLEYQKNKIIEMYEDDYTQAKIAEYFDVSNTYISLKLRSWGKSNLDVNRFKRIDIDRDSLSNMYWDKKMHPSQIAKIYNCSTQTIIDNLIKYNIRMRTKSEARMGALNPIYGIGHTIEAKEKMSKAFENGRVMGYNTHWGKGSYYNTPNQGKVWMRSGWEVKTADYLTGNGINWYYEYEWLPLNQTMRYLPDFFLPKYNCYIEVKGRKKECDMKKFMLAKNKYKILLWDGEELLKLGIITNAGDTQLNRKYRNESILKCPLII
jgi:predicted DNA-binding protein YlxM (UPF0122 family)